MCPDAALPARPAASRRRPRGMTLIELMIVVVVVAVLGAVALPSYRSSVRKAHRAEAKSALTSGAQRLERYYTERNTYVGASVGNGANDTLPPKSENGYYALSLTDVTAAGYLLTAAPQGAQSDDGCGSFTINQAAVRTVSGLSLAECW